jgi:hypothetical protein
VKSEECWRRKSTTFREPQTWRVIGGCLLRRPIFYLSLILRTTCIMPSTADETSEAPSALHATDDTRMK